MSDRNEEKATAAWRVFDVAVAAASTTSTTSAAGPGGGLAGITMVVGDVAVTRPGAGETLSGSEGGSDGCVERSVRDVVS